MTKNPQTNVRVIGAAALAASLLVGLEGYEPPYKDIGGIWTDCYGNTENVTPNVIRSQKECEYLLSERTKKDAERIQKLLTTPATENTLAAFTSFAYNVGFGAFRNSTAVKKWNNGDHMGACRELLRWVYVKGVYVRGLYNRRLIEMEYCIRGLQ